MINILFADSDIETIKSFQTSIKLAFPELKNNKAVIDSKKDFAGVVREVGPHLIVMDVKFFGSRVVAVIRDIHERHPDIRFLLYGTFNEFEYISKSMEFGVLDYMYRPVRASEFIRCMKNALEYIKNYLEVKEEETQLLSRMNMQKSLFRKVFFDSLMKGHLKSDIEIKDKFEYFGLMFPPPFTVFIIRIDNFKKLILTLDEDEKNLLSFKIIKMTEELPGDVKRFINLRALNEISVVISGGIPYNDIIVMCENLKSAIYEKLGIRVTIGIGNQYYGYSDIAVSHNEAEGALRYRFYMGYNSVIPIKYVEPNNNITYRYPLEYENKLVYAAVIGEYDTCVSLLGDIFDALKASGPLPDKLLPKIIMDILISINRYASEQNIIIDNNFTQFFSSKHVLELKETDGALEYLKNALKDFCYYIVKLHDEENIKIYEKLKKYLDSNYKITMAPENIALEFGTTPSYLNKIFMDNEGKTIKDYVNMLRITDAKKLIRDTGLDDEFIAVGVGFESDKQFRSVFKVYEKMSVSDFRRSLSYQNVKYK